MKKGLMLLMLFTFTCAEPISLFAANEDTYSFYCKGDYAGYVVAWVTPDGYLKIKNNSEVTAIVKVSLGTRQGIFTVYAESTSNCGKVATGNNVSVQILSVNCR